MLLNIAHTSQKEQEEGDGNGAEKGGCYHYAGGQSAFVAHVSEFRNVGFLMPGQ